MTSWKTVEPVAREQRKGLYHSNLVAAFDSSERNVALASRIESCVGRAFHAVGSSSETQEIIYWNLLVTKGVGRNEIIDKPAQFIEGLRAIYGEAGAAVFEYMLRREIMREFNLTAAFDKEPIKERSIPDLIHLIAYVALESHDGP